MDIGKNSISDNCGLFKLVVGSDKATSKENIDWISGFTAFHSTAVLQYV